MIPSNPDSKWGKIISVPKPNPITQNPINGLWRDVKRLSNRLFSIEGRDPRCLSEASCFIEGWGERNREIVSVRSHARTRGLVVRWELEKIEPAPSPFPFSLFSLEGISFEFSVVLVSPGEI